MVKKERQPSERPDDDVELNDLKRTTGMTRVRWIQLGGAAFVAFFLVTFNNIPLVVLLQRTSYYRDLVITFLATFGLITYISWVTGWLDARLDWISGGFRRLVAQAVVGVGGGAAMAYGIAFLQYTWIDPYHVFGTDSFFQTEFPVIVLFLVFINSLYAGGAYYRALEKKRPVPDPAIPEKPAFASALIGIQGNRNVNISLDSVGLICVENGITWLFTFENARYHLDEPLQQIMQRLDPAQFFRANRQSIVQLSACYAYQSAEFGKIRLMLVPPFGQEIIISQKTAPIFRKWMDR